jgi:hypothetical protein
MKAIHLWISPGTGTQLHENNFIASYWCGLAFKEQGNSALVLVPSVPPRCCVPYRSLPRSLAVPEIYHATVRQAKD